MHLDLLVPDVDAEVARGDDLTSRSATTCSSGCRGGGRPFRGIVIDVPFVAPPATAAWLHQDARSGFEVVFFHLLAAGRSVSGSRSAALDADGAGRWLVDGRAASHLDGCLDVDLESSAMTNALPVRRMSLPVDARAAAPAAYVRALDLAVERLEQDYVRTNDEDAHQRYNYTAPAFDFACQLDYDESGLVLAYPGIAVRAA